MPSFFVRDSDTGQLRVTIRVVRDLRKSSRGSERVSGKTRCAATYTLYHAGLKRTTSPSSELIRTEPERDVN